MRSRSDAIIPSCGNVPASDSDAASCSVGSPDTPVTGIKVARAANRTRVTPSCIPQTHRIEWRLKHPLRAPVSGNRQNETEEATSMMKLLMATGLLAGALVLSGAAVAGCSDSNRKHCQGKPWVDGDRMDTPLGSK